MLVLSRKKNESIVINNDITVTVVEIRGEIYMPTAEFERMNKGVVEAGEERGLDGRHGQPEMVLAGAGD